MCRRVQQLQYVGEVFDTNRCGEVVNMRCDNCTKNLTSNIEKVRQDLVIELRARIMF